MRYDENHTPISASEAKQLFGAWKAAPAIVLAVSGGPDSTALMWLAARWRRALARGPRLIAVTIDHGLRAEATSEAREVKRLARSLDLPHRTLRWSGAKPSTGLPAAARAARYTLLARAARQSRATHILTAHTRDDQAETVLMRLLRGSGIAGLAAMARETERDGLLLARPFLDVSKSQLIATLKKAKIEFAEDPTNSDPDFTRPRIRALMPALIAEGGDPRNLARLASRLGRANAAVEVLADGAQRYLALRDRRSAEAGLDIGAAASRSFDAAAFAAMPEEIRLRLLLRAINQFGHEGPAELGKVEALLSVLDRTVSESAIRGRPNPNPPKRGGARVKQTLAGAMVSLVEGRIRIEPAPFRRRRR
ncbi:MAG TPA: tRNA lysidine(34) synthetase TilS [Bradyrhizobium sp.]|uniref:tRNA lysidine(34) synthetase TilS n=1 Tax=Bradyrhizobium sp. TaxID=376 RepID=UPI002B47FEA4|nr:tRNA lysidine(34) synthetase TilS [Bradyrhizobium sp.]HKO73208.1 tRNA lysidine(34) synthetase TilS [Bradyrhizobium sp.]